MPENSEKEEKKKEAWKTYISTGTFTGNKEDLNKLNDFKSKLKEKAIKHIDPQTSDEVYKFLTGKDKPKDVE